MDRIYGMELLRSFQTGQISRCRFVSRATEALESSGPHAPDNVTP